MMTSGPKLMPSSFAGIARGRHVDRIARENGDDVQEEVLRHSILSDVRDASGDAADIADVVSVLQIDAVEPFEPGLRTGNIRSSFAVSLVYEKLMVVDGEDPV